MCLGPSTPMWFPASKVYCMCFKLFGINLKDFTLPLKILTLTHLFLIYKQLNDVLTEKNDFIYSTDKKNGNVITLLQKCDFIFFFFLFLNLLLKQTMSFLQARLLELLGEDISNILLSFPCDPARSSSK